MLSGQPGAVDSDWRLGKMRELRQSILNHLISSGLELAAFELCLAHFNHDVGPNN